jgi:hypothetical protein
MKITWIKQTLISSLKNIFIFNLSVLCPSGTYSVGAGLGTTLCSISAASVVPAEGVGSVKSRGIYGEEPLLLLERRSLERERRSLELGGFRSAVSFANWRESR